MKEDITTARNTKKSPTFQRKKVFQILQTHMPELRERYGVRELSLFGSYLRGE
jgi:predicted nucleotidyltransferase